MIGRTGNFGNVYGSYGSHPNSVTSLYNQVTGSREGYGEWEWRDWFPVVDYFFPEEEGPPSYDTVTAKDSTKSVANTKVKDGTYTWVVYSNGDLKIYDVPAGKEKLKGTKYYIGDKNYAKTLGVLRSRSKEVDKVLAKNGLSGAKLAQGATRAAAQIESGSEPNYYERRAAAEGGGGGSGGGGGGGGIGGGGIGGGGGGLQLKATGIAGIAMGVVGLVLFLGLIFKRKRKGRKT